jgi:short subunit dehydrogenase-like uncharacterized protein
VRAVTVVLYGASGYTGRLVAGELHRRGVEHMLSGRDLAKLEPVGAEHGTPVRAVALDDETGLRDLLGDAAAVINCAGPFTLAGDALVRAAIDSGTHYADSTGEQGFVQMVFERHGAAAERAGVALLPSIGFDFLPGDCIARLAAEGHEPLEEVVVAYDVEGFGMSRGTLRSAMEAMQSGGVVYDGGDWRPAPAGVFRASFDFPEPIGRQTMSRYPSAEVITVPRHTQTQRVVSMLTARTVVPIPVVSELTPYLQPGLELAMRTPLRALLQQGVGLLPEGPPEDERRATAWTIVADAHGEDGRTSRTVARGVDVYGITAVILAHAATLLSAPDFDRAGALGPAAAFEPVAFLNFLGDHGVSWERPANVPYP